MNPAHGLKVFRTLQTRVILQPKKRIRPDAILRQSRRRSSQETADARWATLFWQFCDKVQPAALAGINVRIKTFQFSVRVKQARNRIMHPGTQLATNPSHFSEILKC